MSKKSKRKEEKRASANVAEALRAITVEDLQTSALGSPGAPVRMGFGWDGEKYPGGYGPTSILRIDYWTLRARSSELFTTSPHARGIIGRLVTAVVNTGLSVESTPEEQILGFQEDQLNDFNERVEQLFRLWGTRGDVCDYRGALTFGQIQRVAFQEALITGDVLVMLDQHPKTKLPRVRLESGTCVRTPALYSALELLNKRITHGVETDEAGRHVAYYITTEDGKGSRIPAYDSRGRRVAWLVYGTNKRLGEVRGQPLLSLVLQSLKEIDRYRDSVQRKAVLGSLLSLIVTKTEDKIGTRPLANAGVGFQKTTGTTATAGKVQDPRSFAISNLTPGIVIDELQTGEDIKGFPSTSTDEKFSDFEAAIMQGIGWGLGIPPEVLQQKFGSNYAASQASNNEFALAVGEWRGEFSLQLCQPVYEDTILSMALVGLLDQPSLISAWRDPSRWYETAAWFSAQWSGVVKPVVDALKLVNAIGKAIALGLETHDSAARKYNGTKWSKNIKRIRKENEQLRAAQEALVPPQPQVQPAPTTPRASLAVVKEKEITA